MRWKCGKLWHQGARVMQISFTLLKHSLCVPKTSSTFQFDSVMAGVSDMGGDTPETTNIFTLSRTESYSLGVIIPMTQNNSAYACNIEIPESVVEYSPDLNLISFAAFLRFAKRSEGQVVTCPFSCGGCDTKMCRTRIIQCQQQLCPRVMHR